MVRLDRADWQALPLREAYQFGDERGLGSEVNDIRYMEIEWDGSTSSLRRGFVVALFKEKGVLEAFKEACWPNGNNPGGETRIRRYLRIKENYEKFLIDGQISSGDDQQEPEIAQEFAYESDLRDFLAKNLGTLEPGLSLYQDDQRNGIEYSITAGRIDILAKDVDGRLVVIELKVSRGRNPAIGQLLYYMGWVDTNLPRSEKSRGIIVANEVSAELLLACQRIPDVSVYEYALSVTATRVYPSAG